MHCPLEASLIKYEGLLLTHFGDKEDDAQVTSFHNWASRSGLDRQLRCSLPRESVGVEVGQGKPGARRCDAIFLLRQLWHGVEQPAAS